MSEVDLGTLSPSRIGTMNKCGQAFQFQYVNRIPAPYDTGAKIFGIAVHNAVDQWYLAHDYQKDELRNCVIDQWEELLPPTIWKMVNGMIGLKKECDDLSLAIKAARNVKNPEATKDYLTSDAYQSFKEAKNEMLAICDSLDEMKWPKDEDPFKAYERSLEVCDSLQARWRPQPKPLAVEQAFMIEIGDVTVRGRIDQLRRDVNIETGEVLEPTLLDIKTGRQLFSQMDAFIQAYCYWRWLQTQDELPKTNRFEFLHARSGKVQRGTIDPERHSALASRILNGVGRRIAMAQFEPSYGYWCKMCDFNDICSSEISLWDGDGVDQ